MLFRSDPLRLLHHGKVKLETWSAITRLVIDRYFRHPSYWRIDGRPYFSVYEVEQLLATFGSVEATRAALDAFREQAKAAGLPGIHLAAVLWGRPNLPGGRTPADWPKLCTDLGFDSLTAYTWVHHGALDASTFPTSDYVRGRDVYLRFWEETASRLPIPYFPNVTVDWDNCPRAHPAARWERPAAHVVNPAMVGNTPAAFGEALRLVRDRLLASPNQPRIITINAWNEWPEGSCLEPEEKYGYGYLEALREVCGPNPAR